MVLLPPLMTIEPESFSQISPATIAQDDEEMNDLRFGSAARTAIQAEAPSNKHVSSSAPLN